LVLDILDKARYWVEYKRTVERHEALLDMEFSLSFSTAHAYLVMPLSFWDTTTREKPKIREIEFLIVSHDQGWTSESTKGTYETTSFFEASILRPCSGDNDEQEARMLDTLFDNQLESRSNIYTVTKDVFNSAGYDLVRRPSSEYESHRTHCEEMQFFRWLEEEDRAAERLPRGVEGEHAWYLQGNEVARGISTFEGDFIPRYRVVWGCKANPVWAGNEGAGKGEHFLDSLQKGDWICVWARAKVRSINVISALFTDTSARGGVGRTTSMEFTLRCGVLFSIPDILVLHRGVPLSYRSSYTTLLPLTNVRMLDATSTAGLVST
jgi:hypothetical protein